MKPIFKALTSPFRSSKSKKDKKQGINSEIKDFDHTEGKHQNHVDHQKGIQFDKKKQMSLKQSKSDQIYSKVQKMIDQLGSLLNFKEKISEKQKMQLIAQLSVIALQENKQGNMCMEQMYIEQNDQENDQYEVVENNQTSKKSFPQDQINKNFQKAQNSPTTQQSQQSPEKKLQDLYEQFQQQECQQKNETVKNQKQNSLKQLESSKISTKTTGSYSSFLQIKQQMNKFFVKNSSKVFNIMSSKKQSNPPRNIKKAYSSISFDSQNSKNRKEKKSFSISSFLPSFGGKHKQEKGLNCTASSTICENGTSLFGNKQKISKKQNNGHFEWQQSSLGLQNIRSTN